MNLHMENKFFSTRYAWPSPMFRGVYLWDTAFISQVWRPWDVETARDVNWAVLEHPVDGRLRHYTNRWRGSDNTQPPVITWSVWRNYEWGGDKPHLKDAYPVLVDYNRWLYENRRMEGGLFFWMHPYESGIDNSPRFGSKDESETVDMQSLAAIDLNSYMVVQNECLAKMAEALEKPEDADKYRARADELSRLVNAKMWDDESGYYYDLAAGSGELVKIKTIASLFPLFAGIPDEARARRLRDHVMNEEEFNTKIPLPSVARDDPTFEKDCWRGPVWINTAYLVVSGMERYGYMEESALLSWKLVDGVYRVYRNTGKLVEFYDPDRHDFEELSRKKGNLYKQITLGGKPRPNFVGWTGLVNTLLIEHLAGFEKDRAGRRLKPNFPEEARGGTIKMMIPPEGLKIDIELMGDEPGGALIRGEETREFDPYGGETIEIPGMGLEQ